MFLHLLNVSLPFRFVFGVSSLQAGRSWSLLTVEASPCGWGWTSGLSRFPGWGSLCLSSGSWSLSSSLWSAMKCPVVSFVVSMGLVWLWEVRLLMLCVVFLFCWRISVVCLALELVGSWLQLGFSVGIETFGWALVY